MPDASDSTPRLPRTVWVLGWVSLLMDVSSEMIHAVLPLFLVEGLSASMLFVGLMEGAAEGAALMTKVFSGAAADRFGHRKLLVFLGYALGVASKPVFALAGSPAIVLAARLGDRIGKGLRGAPRDAMVADVTPRPLMARAYAVRQALDAAGAWIGPVLAALMLWRLGDDAYRTIFAWAVLPGMICLLLIVFGVESKASSAKPSGGVPKPAGDWSFAWLFESRAAALRALIAVGFAVSLARFSSAFLVLQASRLGVEAHWIPLVMAGVNAVFSFASYPCARWGERFGQVRLLAGGLLLLACAQIVLAAAEGPAALCAGLALWGLHMAAMQGTLSTLVSMAAPPERRAGAFGVFNAASGVGMLVAGLLAGLLWDAFGAQASFAYGAAAAFGALVLLHRLRGRMSDD